MSAEIVFELRQIGSVLGLWHLLKHFAYLRWALWAWGQADDCLVALDNDGLEEMKDQSADIKMVKICEHDLLNWLKGVQTKILNQTFSELEQFQDLIKIHGDIPISTRVIHSSLIHHPLDNSRKCIDNKPQAVGVTNVLKYLRQNPNSLILCQVYGSMVVFGRETTDLLCHVKALLWCLLLQDRFESEEQFLNVKFNAHRLNLLYSQVLRLDLAAKR